MTTPTIFSPAQLAQMTETLLPEATTHQIAVVIAPDKYGVNVVAGFGSKDGHWHAEGAFTHAWAGDNIVAARLLYTH